MGRVTRSQFGKTWRTVLTNAQILALPTTPIEVVPAQGVGRAIIPTMAVLQLIWVADYTNINAAAQLRFITPVGMLNQLIPALETTAGTVSAILANNGSSVSFAGPIITINATPSLDMQAGFDQGDFNNVHLELFLPNLGSGDLTGGDVGNSLIVTVFYNVVELG